MQRGIESISPRIVAPVVVKPLTLSKKAFTKEPKYPEKYIGIAAIKLATIHESATIKKV